LASSPQPAHLFEGKDPLFFAERISDVEKILGKLKYVTLDITSSKCIPPPLHYCHVHDLDLWPL